MAADLEDIKSSVPTDFQNGLNQEEKEILRAFQNGSSETFEYLYNKYADILFIYGQTLTTDTKIIEDAIQDLFIGLWTKRSSLYIRYSIKFYLIKSVRRSIVARLKHVSGKHVRLTDYMDVDVSDTGTEDSETHQRLLIDLKEAIRCLPGKQYEVIMLRYIYDYNYEKIADTLGITLESAYNLSTRALANLRKSLDPVAPSF